MHPNAMSPAATGHELPQHEQRSSAHSTTMVHAGNALSSSYTDLKMQLGDYHLRFPLELLGDPEDSTAEYLRKMDMAGASEPVRHLLGRLRELCAQQHDMIRKLQVEVETEHARNKILRHDFDALQRATGGGELSEPHSATAEEEKHGRKRIDSAEQDEERVVSTLERRLNQLQKEKLELEIAMEQEQEFMVNRLGRQLVEKKQGSCGSLPVVADALLSPPSTLMVPSSHSHSQLNEPDEELRGVRVRLNEVEKDHATRILEYQQEIQRLKDELASIRLHQVSAATHGKH